METINGKIRTRMTAPARRRASLLFRSLFLLPPLLAGVCLFSGCRSESCTEPVVVVEPEPGDPIQIPPMEVGDVLYRHFSKMNVNDAHAAIFYRYTGGDPDDPENMMVIQAVNTANPVSIQNYTTFILEREFFGVYHAADTETMEHAVRESILAVGKEIVIRAIPFVPLPWLTALTPDWTDGMWDGTVGDIVGLRCDGLVEFCYEVCGLPVWYPGSEPTPMGIAEPVSEEDYQNRIGALYTHNTYLTPDTQRTGNLAGHTRLHFSSPEDPSVVSDLESISHGGDNRPVDPLNRRISIRWTDATDPQSGIQGYFIRVDHDSLTIPSWTDSAVVRVDVEDDDPRVLPVVDGYQPEWTSRELEPGSWYVHIRSIDNAGNWGDISGSDLCTAHLGSLIIE